MNAVATIPASLQFYRLAFRPTPDIIRRTL